MPKKTIKTKSKKSASTKSKTVSKKTAKKTTKTALKKKATEGKTAPKKSAAKIKKRSSRTSAVRSGTLKEAVLIEPGPPAISVPSVEEPVANEQAVGTVTHYYSDLNVAIIQVNSGLLKTGSTIHVKGHTTDFIQSIESMEYEHQHVDQASAGQVVGLKVKDHAREHDIVYVVK